MINDRAAYAVLTQGLWAPGPAALLPAAWGVDPVKTRVLKALEGMFAEVPGIGMVYRGDPYLVDLEDFPDPAFFFWVEEDEPEVNNRLMNRILNLNLSWFARLGAGGFQAFQEEAESLQAALHGLLQEVGDLRAVGVWQIAEGLFSTALAHENWGAALYLWRLQFLHQAGNAYAL